MALILLVLGGAASIETSPIAIVIVSVTVVMPVIAFAWILLMELGGAARIETSPIPMVIVSVIVGIPVVVFTWIVRGRCVHLFPT